MGLAPQAIAPRSGWAHGLRAALQSVSTLDSFRACGQPWAREVRVLMAPTGETRRLGVHSCGCCWVCPVCWSRRRIQERAELRFAGGLWLAGGGGLATASITVPHDRHEPLAAVLDDLDASASTLRTGAGRAMMTRFGIEGVLRATEVSWGAINGWHPHQHLLLWLREPLDGPAQAGLIEWWRKWHRRHWEKKRHSPLYKPEHDPYLPDVQRVRPADLDATSNHITKGGSKNTLARYYKARAEGKDELAEYLAQYLAPFELGEEAATGDEEARALWVEYEQTMLGRHWLRWPKAGFRERFGLGPAGKPAPLEGDVVAVVPARSLAAVGLVQGRGSAPGDQQP